MEVKAKLKHLRISPRKVRLVADIVRGTEVKNALSQLKFSNKNAAKPLAKLINSAIANAEHNFELNKDNLFIKELKIDEGATLKRWMPRAFGRATQIRKRTSHILLTLGEIEDSGVKSGKKQKLDDPIKLGENPKEKEEVKEKAEKNQEKPQNTEKEKGNEPVDPRGEGKGKNTKIEGKNQKGFSGKIFRRKSG